MPTPFVGISLSAADYRQHSHWFELGFCFVMFCVRIKTWNRTTETENNRNCCERNSFMSTFVTQWSVFLFVLNQYLHPFLTETHRLKILSTRTICAMQNTVHNWLNMLKSLQRFYYLDGLDQSNLSDFHAGFSDFSVFLEEVIVTQLGTHWTIQLNLCLQVHHDYSCLQINNKTNTIQFNRKYFSILVFSIVFFNYSHFYLERTTFYSFMLKKFIF